MPELPEVETIKLGLQKHLVGHKIEEITLLLPKQFRGDKSLAIGAKILGVRRFGKGLVIDLDNEFSIAIHVKMTGQLVISNKPSEVGKYTHIIFHLDDHQALFYNDLRQFGWVQVLPTKEVAEHKFFKSLGKEPLKDLTLTDFKVLLQKTKTPIKILIMDQSKIAGVGNIYANDALYLAKIHPARPASALSVKEAKELFGAIETVLKKGIETGGASERDYVNAVGGKGTYQIFFLVYKKNGQPCKRCGTIIERIKLGGRGTFFCPACQR